VREIVVLSGKGGTGKTSLAAAFSFLGGDDLIVADCDVDAADMHLLLQPDFNHAQEFCSGLLAEIHPEKCTGCGICAEVCRFEAIAFINDCFAVEPLNCEGCGYCRRVCPENAITMAERHVGEWYVSNTKLGNPMVHARLGIGAENSGKLVAQVKNEARRIAGEQGKNIILVDGSPGIGCPVISSLSGADFVVLVTEPTLSALHDLKRIYQLVKRFNIRAGCIINKADLNIQVASRIEYLLDEEEIMEYDTSSLIPILTESWEKINNILAGN
jgi:MinD superfamily P-loop ATPase